ncbi:MAG: TIGR01212 family radical SAM protein [Syntrophomonadaceae bacterium]
MDSEETTIQLWGDKRYQSLNYFLRQKFGHKVFKVSLDAGFSCPNRDGTLSTTGCLFCSARGSGDFAGRRGSSLEEQFHEVKAFMHKKWPRAGYIAYFQAFTNTYAPPARLRKLYCQASNWEGVVGLAIATRPDCLSEEVLDVLQEVGEKRYLWVELGLQSIHRKSAERFNLGYSFDNFLDALTRLKARGIESCVHLILGLPGEGRDDMMASALKAAGLPLNGLKLHLLHVMQGTPLGHIYQQKPFDTLSRDEYIELVVDILEILPKNMVIHRLTGDSPRQTLLEPQWSLNKWEVLNQIDRRLAERNTWQGKFWTSLK